MYLCSLALCRHNLNTLKHWNTSNSFLSNIRRRMSQKVSQNKSYLAVNIPDNGPTPTNRGFWGFFRRRTATNVAKPEIVKSDKVLIATAKPGIKKSELRRLFSLAKPEKWRLIGAVGFLLVSSTVTMAIPFSLGKVLDIIYNSSSNSDEARLKLNKLCGVLVCIFVAGAICNYGRIYLMSTSGYRMTQALRIKVFSSIVKQEQGWFDKRSTGELVNRLSSDTQIVGQALSSNISDGLRSLAMICAGTGMMLYMSPQLALVGLAVVPPIAGVAVVYGRFVRRITKQVQDSLADATKVAEERIGNMRTVKTFAKELQESDTYQSSIKDVLQLGYREAKARAIFYGMAGLSGNLVIISVLYYGGVLVSSQTISVGNLTSFLLYAAYIGVSVNGLSSFYTELNRSLGAAKKIWEIIDRDPTIPVKGGLVPVAAPNGHIQFKNIAFAYPSREDCAIFEDLSLEINPGCMVAVVGPSGSGKSTLAALLLRLYDPRGGEILLDGMNIRELDPCWLRRHIGTVSQEPVLFSCSIRENILYGADDPEKVSEQDLINVSKEANVYEFVQQLPEGFETLVGERGIMLSGGQKQRVAIARALIKDPRILLLDEATSALDAQSEKLVQEALERVMKGRTVLTIAHRLSTIQNANIIAVLSNGQIVEKGTYSDLLNKENGAFKELMKHQTFHESKC